jgi:hypothetical protein
MFVSNNKEPPRIGFIPDHIKLYQYNLLDCIVSIFKNYKDTTTDRKVIYYFCGYNDYFFHYHMLKDGFDIIVIDIKGFGFNKLHDPTNPYSEGQYFNYYDNIDTIVNKLDYVFSELKNINEYNKDYKKHLIYGHSTGGHIVLSYLYESIKKPITFDRIVLNSPLTKFYLPPIFVPIYYFSKIAGCFTKNIDLRKILRGKKSDISPYINTTNQLIKYIQNDDNQVDLRFKSNIGQPILIGWINCVNSQIAKMKSSKKKINIETIMICSESFSDVTSQDYNHDDTLNPDYCEQDVNKIIQNGKLTTYRKKTGHDIMLEPYNDNDNDTLDNWKAYFDIMFLKTNNLIIS